MKTKKFRVIATFIILAVLCAGVIGCSQAERQAAIAALKKAGGSAEGKWVVEQVTLDKNLVSKENIQKFLDSLSYDFNFLSDSELLAMSSTGIEDVGSWSQNGSELSFKLGDTMFTGTFDGDTITVNSDEGTIVLERI